MIKKATILLIIFIFSIPSFATNDIDSVNVGNSTPFNITSSSWTSVTGGNVTLSGISSGNSTIMVFVEGRLNYTAPNIYGKARILVDGIEKLNVNITQQSYYSTNSFAIMTPTLNGTHYYELQFSVTTGRILYIQKWNMSVIYLKTGSFLLISTYNGNFPNTSLPDYLLISTFNGDYPNTSLVNYLSINTYAGNFPNSSLGNYLLISTYNGDYPNLTLVNYVPFSNTSYLRNTTFFCGTNTTCTYNANGTVSITSTGGTGGGVTMNEVNTSAQLESTVQVTGLNTALSEKEPTISSSTASKFWGWDKTFKDLVAAYITDFVVSVRTNISSTSGLVQYNSGTGAISDTINNSAQITIPQVTNLQAQQDAQNASSAANNTASQARDDAINDTKLNKTDAYDVSLATGLLPSAQLSANQKVVSINYIFDGAGSVLTVSNGNVSVDFNGTIINAVLLGDTTGSAIINITRTTYTNFPASFAPIGNITLSGEQKKRDSALTGWNTSIYTDDVVNVNLSSVSTLTKLTVKLYVQKT